MKKYVSALIRIRSTIFFYLSPEGICLHRSDRYPGKSHFRFLFYIYFIGGVDSFSARVAIYIGSGFVLNTPVIQIQNLREIFSDRNLFLNALNKV